MGVEPPFIYVSQNILDISHGCYADLNKDHPSKYSFIGPTEKGFNPRAATEASWSPPWPKPNIEGPLINAKEFNRHPDSYFVVYDGP